MTTKKLIRVGTRNSELALVQTNIVVDKLKTSIGDEYDIEVVSMTTTGDQILDSPLHKIGSKALFTKELEIALLDDRVDIVVHSLKDLPTVFPEGLVIGAVNHVFGREDPRDVVVMAKQSLEKGWKRLEDLPDNSIIGTSSVRRIAQLKRNYPNLKFEDIRGNLNTRLRKLDGDGKYDAIILAYAGMHRLGWNNRISQKLAISDAELGTIIDEIPYSDKPCYHAVGQGTLAIECRENDKKIIEILEKLFKDKTTELFTTAERTLMKELEGGCSVPLGVACHQGSQGHITMIGIVCSPCGSKIVQARITKKVESLNDAAELGTEVANHLRNEGATEVLNAIKAGRSN